MSFCRIIEKFCGTVQFLNFFNFSKTGSSFRKMYCLHVHDYEYIIFLRFFLCIFESDTVKSDCPVQIFWKMIKYLKI